MSTTLPNVPIRIPIIDDQKLLTPAWVGFFNELFRRVGTNVALSNKELVELINVSTIEQLQTDVANLQGRVAVLEAVPTEFLLLGPLS